MSSYKLGCSNNTYYSRTESGKSIYPDLHAVNLNTRKLRSLLISTNRKNMPSKRRLPKNNSGKNRDNCHNHNTYRNTRSAQVASEEIKSSISESLVSCKLGECSPIGADICKTSPDIHSTQCSDKRSHVEFCNNETIEHTHKSA